MERVIGKDWDGVLIHDGYASYDRFGAATHQQCLAHVLRRARGLLESATRGAVHFPRQMIALFTEAIHLRNQYHQGLVKARMLGAAQDRLEAHRVRLVLPDRAVAAYRTLANHLWHYFESWFTFLGWPEVPATNYRVEQALRPAVVNRKVWGGNRTSAGARAQAILMSVLQTCKMQARSALVGPATTRGGPFGACDNVPMGRRRRGPRRLFRVAR